MHALRARGRLIPRGAIKQANIRLNECFASLDVIMLFKFLARWLFITHRFFIAPSCFKEPFIYRAFNDAVLE